MVIAAIVRSQLLAALTSPRAISEQLAVRQCKCGIADQADSALSVPRISQNPISVLPVPRLLS